MSREYRQALTPGLDLKSFDTVVEATVEDWGGEWQRLEEGCGSLLLPVRASLRQGWVKGILQVFGDKDGSSQQLHYRIEESRYFLQWPAVILLLVAAAGGLFTMLWPFFAHRNLALLNAAPLAALLALGGWFLVISRLQTWSPEDFLQDLAEELKAS